jgi:hypothetical protein
MSGVTGTVRELPLRLRAGLVGGVALGLVGAVVGLVVGLRVYPPTAWAAAVEVGLPLALLGGVLGLGAGSFGLVARHPRR